MPTLAELLNASTKRAGGAATSSAAPKQSEGTLTDALSAVGGVGLGALAAVGNFLDLPGSTVRDILGGEGFGLDQWLTPLSSENRLTGRDVLDRWGVTQQNKTGGISDWAADPMEALRDVGGFAFEVATDPFGPAMKPLARALTGIKPLNMATRGAARPTRLGKVLLDAHPFVQSAGKGLHKVFDKIPGDVQAAAVGWLARKTGLDKAPLAMRSLFSRRSEGATSLPGEQMKNRVFDETRPFNDEVVQDLAMLAQTAKRTGWDLVPDDTVDPTDLANPRSKARVEARNEALRRLAEKVDTGKYGARYLPGDVVEYNGNTHTVQMTDFDGTDWVVQLDGVANPVLEKQTNPLSMMGDEAVPQEVSDFFKKLAARQKAVQSESYAVGGEAPKLIDVVDFSARRASDTVQIEQKYHGLDDKLTRMPTTAVDAMADKHRDQTFMGFYRGTGDVSQMLQDPIWNKIIDEVNEVVEMTGPAAHRIDPVTGASYSVVLGHGNARHLSDFAGVEGKDAARLWEDLFPAGEKMAPFTEIETRLNNWQAGKQRQVDQGLLPGNHRSHAGKFAFNDIAHPGSPIRFTKTYDPGNGIQMPYDTSGKFGSKTGPAMTPLTAADLPRFAHDQKLHDTIRDRLNAGHPVYESSASRTLKKGGQSYVPIYTPVMEHSTTAAYRGMLPSWKKYVAQADNAVTQRELVEPEILDAIKRKYSDRIIDPMPVMNEYGLVPMSRLDPATGNRVELPGMTIKQIEETLLNAKAKLLVNNPALNASEMRVLQLDDTAALATYRQPLLESARDLYEKLTGVRPVGDISIPTTSRYEALTKKIADKAQYRQWKLFGNSPAIDMADYIKKEKFRASWLSNFGKLVKERFHAQRLSRVLVTRDVVKTLAEQPAGNTVGEVLEAGSMGRTLNANRWRDYVADLLIGSKIVPKPKVPAPGYTFADKDLIDAINAIRVDPNILEEVKMLGLMNLDRLPEVNGPMMLFDSFNSMFKQNVLTTPATAVRDGFSTAANAVLTGDMNPFQAFRHMKDSIDLAHGKTVAIGPIPDLDAYLNKRGLPLDDVHRSEALRAWYAGHQRSLQTHASDRVDETARAIGGQMDQVTEITPGMQSGWREMLRKAKASPWQAINPLNARGVWKKEDGKWVRNTRGHLAAEATAKLRETIDVPLRMMQVLHYAKDKGMALQDAFAKMDYHSIGNDPRNYSRFENQYLRRLFPFYGFLSRSVPRAIGAILSNPGGNLAQLIRAQRLAQGDRNGYVPFELQDTAAIQLGEDKDGTMRYLTSFGLMHEDALKYMGNALQGDLRGAMQKMLSSSNPALKWVAEYTTNTSLFAQGPMGGRRLDDLDPLLGRLAVQMGLRELGPSGRPTPIGGTLIESVAAASPLSRWLNIAKTATSSRTGIGEKALNLLTGARTKEFTTEQITRELRDRLNAMQIEAGARPLSIVSGTEALQQRLKETGNLDELARLKKIDLGIQWLRKQIKEATPGGEGGKRKKKSKGPPIPPELANRLAQVAAG